MEKQLLIDSLASASQTLREILSEDTDIIQFFRFLTTIDIVSITVNDCLLFDDQFPISIYLFPYSSWHRIRILQGGMLG